MRQVTGSNQTTTDKKVSIQLLLDGQLFIEGSVPSSAKAEQSVVEIELLTAKAIVVPAECFEPELATNLLQLSGIECGEGEYPVWSQERDGMVAVMVMRKDAADLIAARVGTKVSYTSPLLRTIGKKTKPYLYIYYKGNAAYLKLVRGTSLEFCEAITVSGADDILCFAERLAQEFGLTDLLIGIAGNETTPLVNLLKQYYKVEKCE